MTHRLALASALLLEVRVDLLAGTGRWCRGVDFDHAGPRVHICEQGLQPRAAGRAGGLERLPRRRARKAVRPGQTGIASAQSRAFSNIAITWSALSTRCASVALRALFVSRASTASSMSRCHARAASACALMEAYNRQVIDHPGEDSCEPVGVSCHVDFPSPCWNLVPFRIAKSHRWRSSARGDAGAVPSRR